jgi:hypothetical protein
MDNLTSKQGRSPVIQSVNAFRAWLIEPSPYITEPVKRRSARLLTVFILSLFLLFAAVNLSYSFTIPDYQIPVADLIGYGLILVVYVLSRTRYSGMALVLMLFMFPLNVFMNILQDTSMNITATLLFLIPSYVIASIFLRASGVAIYGFFITALIALVPILTPGNRLDYSDIIGPLAVNTIVVVLLIIAVVHRNHVEQDRQSELKMAYDHSLESWAHALEIRDRDTEGHSRRVADMTVELARACKVGKDQLEHIYRGALLHDIGKMAIPDAILQKPAALTEEEWMLMHRHPDTAIEMMADIPFLAPAMEIPNCHHESWDGKGYPNHLKGEKIPLSARIFTIVDTWDALISERPYRKAWSRDKALKYIQEQSGIKFDPTIVPKFIRLLKRHKLV